MKIMDHLKQRTAWKPAVAGEYLTRERCAETELRSWFKPGYQGTWAGRPGNSEIEEVRRDRRASKERRRATRKLSLSESKNERVNPG